MIVVGYLHDVGCDGENCRCERVHPVPRSHAWRAGEQAFGYNGVSAGDVGDSSVRANRIDSTTAPADQLSPGSVGVTCAIEGIVR